MIIDKDDINDIIDLYEFLIQEYTASNERWKASQERRLRDSCALKTHDFIPGADSILVAMHCEHVTLEDVIDYAQETMPPDKEYDMAMLLSRKDDPDSNALLEFISRIPLLYGQLHLPSTCFPGEPVPTIDDISDYIGRREHPLMTWIVNRAAAHSHDLMHFLRRYGGLHDHGIPIDSLLRYLRGDIGFDNEDLRRDFYYSFHPSINPRLSDMIYDLAYNYIRLFSVPPVLPGGARYNDELFNLTGTDADLGDLDCERFILERYFDKDDVTRAAARFSPNSYLDDADLCRHGAYAPLRGDDPSSHFVHPLGRLLRHFGAEVSLVTGAREHELKMRLSRGYPVIAVAYGHTTRNRDSEARERAARIAQRDDDGITFLDDVGPHPWPELEPDIAERFHPYCVLILPAWTFDEERDCFSSHLVYAPREGFTTKTASYFCRYLCRTEKGEIPLCDESRAATVRPAQTFFEGYEGEGFLPVSYDVLVTFRPPKAWNAHPWDFTPLTPQTDILHPLVYRTAEEAGDDGSRDSRADIADLCVRHLAGDGSGVSDLMPEDRSITAGLSDEDLRLFSILTSEEDYIGEHHR